MKSLRAKIVWASTSIMVVAVLVLLVISQINLSKTGKMALQRYDDAVDEGYNKEIKSEVQTAMTVMQNFYDQAQAGTYTEEEAKNLAKETIRSMRYGDEGDGYFWIDDTDYNLVMHPILPDQEGTNRHELEDKNGVMIIQEIMKAADKGGGYNKFYFTKSDGVTVAPKIAYSEKFEPWNWVITTGNYVDDINKAKSSVEKNINGSVYSGSVVKTKI